MGALLALHDRLPAAGLAAVLLALGAPLHGGTAMPVDGSIQVFANGVVITNDPGRPRAGMLVIDGARVAWCGEPAELPAAWRDIPRRDLEGAVIVPGLADAHLHVEGVGRALDELDLVGTESLEAIVAMVADAVEDAPAGAWIQGRGWDQNDWAPPGMPRHDALSRQSPRNPVCLRRIDGHAALVNAAALQAAGLTATTADPPGGKILRDAGGEPTGVLIDAAVNLVTRHIPDPTPETRRRWIAGGLSACAAAGLTMVHDAGVDTGALAAYRALLAEERLPIRVNVMLDGGDEELLREMLPAGPAVPPEERLIIRTVKLYADGALGSRGAALLAPYADEPSTTGLFLTAPDALEAAMQRIDDAGFQCAVHAIGDRANRVVLDIIEELQRAAPHRDRRHRIEHAQIVAPGDIRRFAELGVVASMQFTHATSDMPWADERLGPERLTGAYVWKALLETGAVLAQGSDAPVESVNPWWGLYAGMTRQDAAGQPAGGWFPEQRLSAEEALAAATRGAARAAFLETKLGALKPGYWADFIICDTDPLQAEPSRVRNTQVHETWVGGEKVYP
ncbi:MAG: amidohydrolase family protein [Candidatus Eisenbacteria bacterium]|nr:amidohydrolase family protein [Candidatus Eisenbacteria bacterium]